MENTVDIMEQGLVQDDAVLEPMQETEEQHPSLDEFIEQPAEQAPTEEVHLPKREPGWVRQRVDKAVQKAIQETEARMRAEFEGTLAPIRESMMEREADNLVASGEFKTRERAMEYVRMKNGLPGAAQPTAPQQQAPQQVDPEVKARGNLLAQQAAKIRTNMGVDVMAEYNSNSEVRQKILSGEWDFYDVAQAMQGGNQRRTPPLVRSPGGSGLSGKFSISDMNDAQFEQLQKNLRAGKVYDAR